MAKSRAFVSPRNSRKDLPTQTRDSNHHPRNQVSPGRALIHFAPMWKLLFICALAIASVHSTGCCYVSSGRGGGYINDFMERQVACMRDHVWAKRSFHLRFGRHKMLHADHFRDGFVCGYQDVCDGCSGEVPVLPPEKYWSYQYESAEGAQMQNVWFDGYKAGSAAAKADGLDAYNKIQVSREDVNAMEQAKEIERMRSGLERHEIIEMTPADPAFSFPDSAEESAIVNQAMPGLPHTMIPAPGTTPYRIESSQPTPFRVTPAVVPIIPGPSNRQLSPQR